MKLTKSVKGYAETATKSYRFKKRLELQAKRLERDLKRELPIRLKSFTHKETKESHYEYLKLLCMRLKEYRLALRLSEQMRIRALKIRLQTKYKKGA